MEKRTFTVSGMRCPHCKANVENALKGLAGVEDAVASVEQKNVVVSYDAQRVTPEAMKEAVEASGRYELEL